MQYVCLVYFREGTLEGMSETEFARLVDESIEADQDLKARGHLIVATPLQGPEASVTVSVRNGRTTTVDGPFAETKEAIAGFFMIEARDMAEAIRLVEGNPTAHQGFVEIRPVMPRIHSQTGVEHTLRGPA
jgi:hypothetical protein